MRVYQIIILILLVAAVAHAGTFCKFDVTTPNGIKTIAVAAALDGVCPQVGASIVRADDPAALEARGLDSSAGYISAVVEEQLHYARRLSNRVIVCAVNTGRARPITELDVANCWESEVNQLEIE